MEQNGDFRTLGLCRKFEALYLLLIMAAEMTAAAVCALVATRGKDWLKAAGITLLCMAASFMAETLLLRLGEGGEPQAPVFLLGLGTVIWLAGTVWAGCLFPAGTEAGGRETAPLILSAGGGALALTGLGRLAGMMPDIARITGRTGEAGERSYRGANRLAACLIGLLPALLTAGVFVLINREAFTRGGEFRHAAILVLPIIAALIAAFVCALKLPVDWRFAIGLRRFLRLEKVGEENIPLRKKLREKAEGPYGQPGLTRVLIWILRPILYCRLADTEHFVPDDRNPPVFICNHGEVFGPLVCALFFPVPFRSWTISMMMTDPEEVKDYLYRNTFGPKKWLPDAVGRFISGALGRASVTVMRQLEAIPVYRDQPMKLRETIRLSTEALEAGDPLLIFPEDPEGKYEREGISRLNPGFVMPALAYGRKTGKRLRFIPVYADKAKRRIAFGEEIPFDPDRPFAEEQDRIVKEAEVRMLRMAGMEEKARKVEKGEAL